MRIDHAAMFHDSTGIPGNDLIPIVNRKFPDIDFYSVEKVNVNAGELHDIPFA